MSEKKSINEISKVNVRKAVIILSVALLAACGAGAKENPKGRGPQSNPSGGGAMTNSGGNFVEITLSDGYRHVRSNGIPDHQTGSFPNAANPHTIQAQNLYYKMTASPQWGPRAYDLGLWPFGVALNGIPFDPYTAEWYQNDRNSGWHYEALSGFINLGADMNNAHVQPNGLYHYHGLPWGVMDNDPFHHSNLIGYAADGYPIYAQYGYSDPGNSGSPIKQIASSYRLKSGNRSGGPGGAYDGTFIEDYHYQAGTGDLDECNGRNGVTPEYPQGTYHYFVTDSFPYVPRCFKGTPDQSFIRGMMRMGPEGDSSFSREGEHRHFHPHFRH